MDWVGAGGVDDVRVAVGRVAPVGLGAAGADRAGGVGAAGIGPVVRAGGCAGPRAPAPAPPPLLAQLAAPPFAVGGAPLVGSGSGGAVRPVPTPAPGHCLAAEWLSAVGPPGIPSDEVARTPSVAPCPVPSAAPPPSAAVRRAHRDARAALAAAPAAPGTTVPAAVAVTRRNPKADSRHELSARSLAPSMP